MLKRSPCSANSLLQNIFEQKPRSSRSGSISMIVTPATSVGMYLTRALPSKKADSEKRWDSTANQTAIGTADQRSHCVVLSSSRYWPALVHRVIGSGIQHGLLDREGFGRAGAALHSPDTHQGDERFVDKRGAARVGGSALPAHHRAFAPRLEMMALVDGMRRQSRGKPDGF